MSRKLKLLGAEQLLFVRDNWEKMTDEEMAKHVGITKGTLRNRRLKMGLRAPKRPSRKIKRQVQLSKTASASNIITRPCPRTKCDGTAERSDSRLLCTKCSSVWILGSIQNEELLATFPKETTLTFKSIGTNRTYRAKKLGGGKSTMRVYFSGNPIDMIWEDFVDMFELKKDLKS